MIIFEQDEEKYQAYCDSCCKPVPGELNPGPHFGFGSRFWLCDWCYRTEYGPG